MQIKPGRANPRKVVPVLRANAFLIGIGIALMLAVNFPEWGAPKGPLHAKFLANLGVQVIFLLQGLTLPLHELKRGVLHWKLHVWIQICIFGIAGILFLGAAGLLSAIGQGPLSVGFIYLAVLPTTIASAIAFTSSANGNVAAALFNTTFANIFGIFWVPAICLIAFSTTGEIPTGQLGALFQKLAALILLPLVIGQILQPFARRIRGFPIARKQFKWITQSIILFIIFTAFSGSVMEATWEQFPLPSFALVALCVLLCLISLHWIVWTGTQLFFAEFQDRITALFCGSQKTLATGAPMAMAIFSTLPQIDIGTALLPLLLYHPLQLLLAAAIVQRLKS